MKKTTKIISLLLAMIIALSAFSISGFAVATPLDAGNSQETATAIPEFGVEYVSSLSAAGEVDWFKFTTLSEDAYYIFNLENYNIHDNSPGENWSLNLYVYDAYGQKLVNVQGTGNANIKLEKNTTYFIKVNMGRNFRDSTGNYEVCITYKLDSASNIKEEATEIYLNTTYNQSLDGTDDADWFKFTSAGAGEYELVLDNHNIHDNSPGENWSLNLYVLDIYDRRVANQQGGGRSLVSLEANTTYYILVNMGSHFKASTGNYSFSVNFESAAVLSDIAVSTLPVKTQYIIGESIDVSGLTVEATYSDGTTKLVEGYSITGFDSATAGTKTVTISYTEGDITCTCTFDVTVSALAPDPDPAVELTGITCTALPSKTTYAIGESFNESGLSISAQYSDGTRKSVSNYTITGFDSATAGVKTITVSYTEGGITKTCTFNVTVVAQKELIAISIAAMPSKTVYQTGEDFDASGLVVNAFYSDGTSSFVTNYTVSGFDSATAGTKSVIVSYTDNGVTKSCSFEVKVEEPAKTGNFFTDLINSIVRFFMSIIEFFTSILG